jgi:hypothetical protein
MSAVCKAIRETIPKPVRIINRPSSATKNWRIETQDSHKLTQFEYYQLNKQRSDAQSRDWRLANPEKAAEISRRSTRKRLGIIDATGEARFGICPICLRDKPLVCDHYHNGPNKGLVRGWICGTCNRGIGSLQDSIDSLNRAVIYMNNSEIELSGRIDSGYCI